MFKHACKTGLEGGVKGTRQQIPARSIERSGQENLRRWLALRCGSLLYFSGLSDLFAPLNEIKSSIAIQNEGFKNLVLGSSVTLDEVKRAPSNWYVAADEAKQLGLVEAVL